MKSRRGFLAAVAGLVAAPFVALRRPAGPICPPAEPLQLAFRRDEEAAWLQDYDLLTTVLEPDVVRRRMADTLGPRFLRVLRQAGRLALLAALLLAPALASAQGGDQAIGRSSVRGMGGIGVGTVNGSTLTVGLTHDYHFDGDGTDAASAENLTGVNSPGFGVGKVFVQATDLTAASAQYWTLADTANWDPTGDWTIEVWFFGDAFNGSLCGKNQSVALREWELRWSGSTLLFQMLQGAFSAVSVAGISVSAWHQVLVSHTPGTIRIRLDNGTPGTTAFAGLSADRAGSFDVGRRPDNGTYFDGRIGPLRRWSRLLTSDEEDETWNSGAGKVL